MAIFNGNIRSSVLAMDTQLTVILPYDRPAQEQKEPCPVLYLLHGLGDNNAAWTRYTGIERYARDYGLAVVMPEVQRSFYYDMAMGMQYFTYITQELPALCGQMFHLSRLREDTFVAGLSMGGYGAMKCAFTYPAQYKACASFSGLCQIGYVMEKLDKEEYNERMFKALFGDDLTIRDSDDLFYLAKSIATLPRQQRPGLFFSCGHDDFLYEQNTALRDHLNQLGLDFRFEHWPGDHEWGFWDKSIQKALSYFFPA